MLLRLSVDELGLGLASFRAELCRVNLQEPNRFQWGENSFMRQEIEEILFDCEWNLVYDLAERIYAALGATDEEDSGARQTAFEEALNEFFLVKGYSWKMKDGLIAYRGGEVFEATLKIAQEALSQHGRETSKLEIAEALLCLSRRPAPDLTGAVQHAYAAMECAARDEVNSTDTFGRILAQNPQMLPPELVDPVKALWRYGSNNARHLVEGGAMPDREVELVVGIAATLSTYLSR